MYCKIGFSFSDKEPKIVCAIFYRFSKNLLELSEKQSKVWKCLVLV